MHVLSFLRQSRVLIVTGKGGTGKTTVSAVAANLAARDGARVALVQVAPASARTAPQGGFGHLPFLFACEGEIGYEPALLRSFPGGGEVTARALAPDTALVEYLDLHGMRRLSKRLVASGALDVVATAVPGMPDMLVLGKIKQMERASGASQLGAPDLIVVDAPAAGHAIRFLQGPGSILAATGGGPIRGQAQEVVEMLSDPGRCRALLVTTPEETPVSETVETARLLDDRAGVEVGGVVVNARLPLRGLPGQLDEGLVQAWARQAGAQLGTGETQALVSAGLLRAQRQSSQAAQVARLAVQLPVPQFELPFCFTSELGRPQLDALTDAFASALGHDQGRQL